MEAHNSHSKSLSCTVPSGDHCCDVPRTITRFVSFTARLPPGYLPRIPFNTKPATSKELNVASAASKINGNFIC